MSDPKRRQIDKIVIHCSATPAGMDIGAAHIRAMHTRPKSKGGRGWRSIGYHWIVRLGGAVEAGQPENLPGIHVAGHNADSIGVCYIGGLDAARQPADTRTPKQKAAMARLVRELLGRYPGARVVGHRDLSPDRNSDGRITPDEWLKACPCFDVAEWLRAEKIGDGQ